MPAEPAQIKNRDCFPELPEGKIAYPTRPDQAPFRELKRYLDIDRLSEGLEAVREIRDQTINKLDMLDRVHRELIEQARNIVEKAREDLRLHSVPMHASKIRNRVYYLYSRDRNDGEVFFSILDRDEYEAADPDSRYMGAYRLNEDSSWTRLD